MLSPKEIIQKTGVRGGEVVVIKRKNSRLGWNTDMDAHIGTISVVQIVNETSLELMSNDWDWPIECFDIATPYLDETSPKKAVHILGQKRKYKKKDP